MSRRAVLALALTLGIATHAAFLAAIATMVVTLHGGMQGGLGRLSGVAASAANGALLLQFPLLHSWLLSRRGRRVLVRLAPSPTGERLASTTYVLVASLQLLAAFLLWSPSGVVWWSSAGALRAVLTGAFVLSWALLARAMADAGLAVQAGWLGWTSVWRGRAPDYGPMPERGLFRLCRQPVYLAFALTLWTVPTWSPDALAVAATWTAYCALGPLHKEARYLRLFGARFDAYRARTRYLLPWPPRDAPALAAGYPAASEPPP